MSQWVGFVVICVWAGGHCPAGSRKRGRIAGPATLTAQSSISALIKKGKTNSRQRRAKALDAFAGRG